MKRTFHLCKACANWPIFPDNVGRHRRQIGLAWRSRWKKLLREAAYQLDDRPVRESEAIALGDAILEPIARAVEFLNGKDDDPIEIVASLSRASR